MAHWGDTLTELSDISRRTVAGCVIGSLSTSGFGMLPVEQAPRIALNEAVPSGAAEGMLVALLKSLIDPDTASE